MGDYRRTDQFDDTDVSRCPCGVFGFRQDVSAGQAFEQKKGNGSGCSIGN